VELINDHADMMMFCSDDKHPDSLVEGHINQLCSRSVAKGIDVFKVLKAACVNPVNHYQLKVGLLRQNDFADFIVVKDLQQFEVVQTYINGRLVADNGRTLIEKQKATAINNFSSSSKEIRDFQVNTKPVLDVIGALDGQLITNKISYKTKDAGGYSDADKQNDILKIVVVNRYQDLPVAKAFIKNFSLKKGAIASSVAHDSHNIVAVGVDDESIAKAVNLVIKEKGGVSCVGGKEDMILPLPVAGLMSAGDGYEVARKYAAIDKAAKELGSALSAPFMTLSFMALLVIPHLKLSDLGLFDGDSFSFINEQ
jgi:adenine deaminase